MKPYYERDGITIYHGDCLEVLPNLSGSFDAVVSDPPFGFGAALVKNRAGESDDQFFAFWWLPWWSRW